DSPTSYVSLHSRCRKAKELGSTNSHTLACLAECSLLKKSVEAKDLEGIKAAEKKEANEALKLIDAAGDSYISFVKGLVKQAERDYTQAANYYKSAFKYPAGPWQLRHRVKLAAEGCYRAGELSREKNVNDAFECFTLAANLAKSGLSQRVIPYKFLHA